MYPLFHLAWTQGKEYTHSQSRSPSDLILKEFHIDDVTSHPDGLTSRIINPGLRHWYICPILAVNRPIAAMEITGSSGTELFLRPANRQVQREEFQPVVLFQRAAGAILPGKWPCREPVILPSTCRWCTWRSSAACRYRTRKVVACLQFTCVCESLLTCRFLSFPLLWKRWVGQVLHLGCTCKLETSDREAPGGCTFSSGYILPPLLNLW